MVPLSAVAPLGVGLGVILGLGLWLVLAAVPRIGRPSLMERVAPYVADLSPEARSLIGRRSADPAPVLGLVVLPAARQFRSLVSAWLGGSEVIARRLRQAGSQATVERFRAEQLAWAAAAFAIAAALTLLAPTFTGLPTVVRVAFPFVFAALGAVVWDWMLQRRARRRLARISSELPTVLEFLTLSLTAGEGMLDAIRRVATAGSGELPGEFARVVTAVGAGAPLGSTLDSSGWRRTSSKVRPSGISGALFRSAISAHAKLHPIRQGVARDERRQLPAIDGPGRRGRAASGRADRPELPPPPSSTFSAGTLRPGR